MSAEEDPRLNRDKFNTGLTQAQAVAKAAEVKAQVDAGNPPPEVTGGPSANTSGEDKEQA